MVGISDQGTKLDYRLPRTSCPIIVNQGGNNSIHNKSKISPNCKYMTEIDEIKLYMSGSFGVGKTSIIVQFIQNVFIRMYPF